MWERTARKRARRGAKHFDKVKPGWFLTINTDKLTIHSDTDCPFAQVIGEGRVTTYKALPSLRWGFRHGFLTTVAPYHLNNAWVAEIKKRLDAAQAELDAPATMPAGLAESIMRHPSSG